MLARLLLGTAHEREFLATEPFAGLGAWTDAGDVTTEHLHLGYRPTLVALETAAETVVLHVGEIAPVRNAVASLTLQRRAAIGSAGIFEATRGTGEVLGLRGALAHRLLELRHPPRVGEDRLSPAEAARNRALYAVPRAVDLATVALGDRANRFPLDLHGAIGETWLVSLRRGARSLEQVLEARRVLVAAMPASHAREVYALGPGHRSEPREIDAGEARSPGGVPVPAGALGWWELAIEGTALAVGEHVVLHGRAVAAASLAEGARRLHHVHRDVVTRLGRAGTSVPIVER